MSAPAQKAIEILRENDRGSHDVPTHGLYPFQWNKDRCLTALGQAHFDEDRAWTGIETLMVDQWPCGMVPQFVLHQPADGCFPGPGGWQTGRPVPNSGIARPALAGFALRQLWDRSSSRAAHEPRLRALCPRSPPGSAGSSPPAIRRARGWLPGSTPGKSGRDNSADRDVAFARVPETTFAHTRTEILPADPSLDGKRCWRGPVWLVVNYMIAGGLARAGQTDAAARITAASLDLTGKGGCAEHHDRRTGKPCGGTRFAWTAAMVRELAAMPAAM